MDVRELECGDMSKKKQDPEWLKKIIEAGKKMEQDPWPEESKYDDSLDPPIVYNKSEIEGPVLKKWTDVIKETQEKITAIYGIPPNVFNAPDTVDVTNYAVMSHANYRLQREAASRLPERNELEMATHTFIVHISQIGQKHQLYPYGTYGLWVMGKKKYRVRYGN